MKNMPEFLSVGCRDCRSLNALAIDFSMAFQPIVDVSSQSIFGYEALVRGLNAEGAAAILGQVDDTNRYRFDQACRVKAIDLAARLGLEGMLSINFLPNAVYRPETCIRATLEAAKEHDFPTNRIMFEVTEGERVTDHAHLKSILTAYRELGFMTAIDDFGAGYSGLNLLAEFQPHLIKIDMALTRNIDKDHVRRAIVFAILTACRELGIRVIAEGVETREECLTLADEGVELFQGYLFARPQFEQLPIVPPESWAAIESRRTATASLRSSRR
jgi:EAL domain-containing protein (putative c-di-GMP-specific phosphodiesterase class I)